MTHSITRRRMLQATAATAAAVAAPAIVPSSVFGKDAPSNTILFGAIGVGRMGHWDIANCLYQGLERNVRVVAVCDLDSIRADKCSAQLQDAYQKKLGKKMVVKPYTNHHEMLARKDIDGVTISTPDHWHALTAIDAAKAGKDIHVQKPMTYSIAEGQALIKAVRQNKRILQVGSQQRSSERFRRVCELVRNNALGKLTTIEVVIPTDHGYGDPTPAPVPKNLNYEKWMGPTAVAPYAEHRVHPQNGYGRPGWLQIECYCRGMITGWGAHMYDIAQWALGCDLDGGPVNVMAAAEFPKRGLFNVHTNYIAEANYANGVKMISHNGRAGVKFIGEKGWIWVERGKFNAAPYDLLRTKLPDDAIRLPVSNNHMGNFLDCVRSRKDPIAPVEAGHRSNSVCVLHHIAMKLGGRLKWDPAKEQFIDNDEANKMLDYPHRKPYTL